MQTCPTITRKAISFLGAFSILVLAVPVLNSRASAQTDSRYENESRSDKDHSSSRIEGSWILANERVNEGFTFSAVASFTAGGVWLATGSIDPQNTPLYGSWKRRGPNRYDSTAYFYAFDPAGNAVAMIKVNQTFELTSPNELTGDGVGFACDLQAENCVSVPAVTIRIKGRRIVPEKSEGHEQ